MIWKYRFIQAPTNQQLSVCPKCKKVFSNKAMKPFGLIEHLKAAHPDKAGKNQTF